MMNKCWLTLLCFIGLVLSPVAFGWNDSDKDGVPDIKDACPHTAMGVLVDASGCDKSRLFKPICLITSDDKVYPETCIQATELALNFEFAKTEVLYSQWQVLAQIKQFLQLNDVKLCLIGHTDSVGSVEANLLLSEARAKTVMGILVDDYGFDPERFIVRGVGTRSPIGTNNTPVGRALNRRVNFVVEVSH